MRWFQRKEAPLFRTYQPSFRAPGWAVGQVLQHKGHLYRVTRWEELPPVHMERGGSVSEFQIWGTRLSDEEARSELLDAVDRITEEDVKRRTSDEAGSEQSGG